MKEKINKELLEKIGNVLSKIRPYLEADGGDISFVELTDDYMVKVKMHGACQGCPFSYQTLKAGVEQALMKEIPEIKGVEAVD